MGTGRCALSNAKPKQYQRPTHCYKGRCRGCNAVLASAYDMIEAPKETGEMVADMVRSGLIVAHEPFPGASMGECTCEKPEQQEHLL